MLRQYFDDIYPLFICNMNLQWREVLHLGIKIKYSKKQVVKDTVNDLRGFYFLHSGKVRASYISECGLEKNVLFIGPGSIFNEVPSVSNSYSSSFFTSMDSNTETYFFSKKHVLSDEFMSAYPHLIRNLIETMGVKACYLFSQACNFGLYDSFQNVCRVLYGMAVFNTDASNASPQLSQQDIASFVGIHRGTLHKILRRLKDEGVIGSYSKYSLDVINLERLRDYASTSEIKL